MSKILSGKTTSSNAAAFTEHKTNPFQASSSQQNQQGQQTQALFPGANIGVINIQLLVIPCSTETEKSQTMSLKRRRHFIIESDSEDEDETQSVQ